MKLSNLIIKVLAIFLTVFVFSFSSQAKRYSRYQAAQTIEQTAYIINQAYDIANYYSYWHNNSLSKAMYYNDYASRLYEYRSYKSAIRYSLLAREYALDVIDDCDDYWEYFYYTYYGWSVSLGYNHNFAYSRGYMDGYYDGYYAHYCYRNRHDYRKDPHHSMQNAWYDDTRYSDVSSGRYFTSSSNRGNTSIGRGDTGRNSGTSSSSSTTVTRNSNNRNSSSSGRKNILLSNYFSDDEVSILKDMPSNQTLEDEFKDKNPEITFDDKNLKPNTSIVTRSKQNAQMFSSKSDNNTTSKRVAIATPDTTSKPNTSNKQQPENIRTIHRSVDNITTTNNHPNITPTNRANTITNRNSNNNFNYNSNNKQNTNNQTIKPRSTVSTPTTTKPQHNNTTNKQSNTTKIQQPTTIRPQQNKTTNKQSNTTKIQQPNVKRR